MTTFSRAQFLPRSLRHDARLMMCDYLPPPQRGPGSVQCDEIKSFPFVRAECHLSEIFYVIVVVWTTNLLLIRMPTPFVISSFN
jgi:hypothetical protein